MPSLHISANVLALLEKAARHAEQINNPDPSSDPLMDSRQIQNKVSTLFKNLLKKSYADQGFDVPDNQDLEHYAVMAQIVQSVLRVSQKPSYLSWFLKKTTETDQAIALMMLTLVGQQQTKPLSEKNTLEAEAKKTSGDTEAQEMHETIIDGLDSRVTQIIKTQEVLTKLVTRVAENLNQMVEYGDRVNTEIERSTGLSDHAASETQQASGTIDQLQNAAEKIQHIVKLISDIAAKTNLLALNATIEAARAGEAGKGFTVVASEVKNLASQTAAATTDISDQISNVLKAISNTTGAITGVNSTMKQVQESSHSIALTIVDQRSSVESLIDQVNITLMQMTQGAGSVGVKVETDLGHIQNAVMRLVQRNNQIRGDLEVYLSNLKAMIIKK